MSTNSDLRTRENLAWAAGLFDGEGSICRYRQKQHGKIYWRSALSLHMCDQDVVAHFVRVIGVGTLAGPYNYSTVKTKRKSSWYWSVAGFERVQAVIAMLWPWLGERRKQKAREVLTHDLKTQPKSRRSRDEFGRFAA